MNVRIINYAFHRNGITGVPFEVVRFTADGWDMLAVLFEAEGYCAVFSMTRLALGLITFGENSYRGDVFEPHLRKAVNAYLKSNQKE